LVGRVLYFYSSPGSLRISPHVAQLASIPFKRYELSDDGGSNPGRGSHRQTVTATSITRPASRLPVFR
jgi:hypothetical protein